MFKHENKLFINGEWIDSTNDETIDVINPATEEVIGTVSASTKEDLDKAVKAARDALPAFSKSIKKERIDLLNRIADEYEKRKDEFIDVMTMELGAPKTISENVHYEMGLAHFRTVAKALEYFSFEEERGDHTIVKESVGVSGLITPWNFPTNQTSTKIAGAFAAGSPVVLKPSEETPYAAIMLAEIIDRAGAPKGAFNLVNGTGATIGDAISSHPDIDFVSFTGSGPVGTRVMQNASETIKNVALELGGKSPLLVLKDADVQKAAQSAAEHMMLNSGQVCSAATRVLVPKEMKADFERELVTSLEGFPMGDPQNTSNFTGPLISKKQYDTVQSYIKKGQEEGARIVQGGEGKPDGLETGYFAKPTIFSDVTNDMVVAREEIFGPVTTIITYDGIEEGLQIANDTPYGLAGYVAGEDEKSLKYAASHIRAGQITINDAKTDHFAPFGGFKQSGIGREWGDFGIEEYLEEKAIMGV
ncbi:aldehyde dehydrogenase family protein [Geomicrobium sp. JCM 19039]|uniref:aldehyde dehydrogenase family protein n=1 Tax=Geomicrobium sp. JCM 19039 TaxID=1460636 RepID=UPI00045F44FB|nr:aldehyde dehydrogenase family protein [Geomicrobium sp. JCM 19039]GAK13367.1 aldehyde dehydrogenase [Geomicrobium sp. JCM 19039]